jgi:hypothetical protein
MEVSPESLKVLVGQLLDSKVSKKFDTIVEVGSFLWEVVDKITETTKDSNLSLQQKEDLLVKVSENVVTFMEEKGVVTIELADRFRSLIKTADVFLDVVIGIYSFVSMKKTVDNPTAENCFKTMFSLISCFSKKAANVVENKPEPITSNSKVEEIKVEEVKTSFEKLEIAKPIVLEDVSSTGLDGNDEKKED